MADKYANEVKTAFNMQCYISRADPTEKFATAGENGRSDLVVLKNGRGVAVEIKSGKTGFNFTDWRSNQREWASKYCAMCGVPYFIWLNLGEARQKSDLDRGKLLRRAWLIPEKIFLEAEDKIKAVQTTLPYQVGKGYNTFLQENKLDAITLFKDFELSWSKLVIPWNKAQAKYCWVIPTDHPFYKFFEV